MNSIELHLQAIDLGLGLNSMSRSHLQGIAGVEKGLEWESCKVNHSMIDETLVLYDQSIHPVDCRSRLLSYSLE